MIEPDEAGFSGRLRALATRLLDQHAADLPDRATREGDLFRALRSFAQIREMSGSVDDMARCEAMGTLKVRQLTEPSHAAEHSREGLQ